jgi:pimeloyl-ACP methyl ester carboxylesterase
VNGAPLVNGQAPAVTTVPSRDGVKVGFWSSGEGPPLVLVHGLASNHTTWDQLVPYLTPHFTCHAVDRRGRGASGDAGDYDISLEFADVAAVVDAVAEASGGPAHLLGHSLGGLCAAGAVELTSNVASLILYEPTTGIDPTIDPPAIRSRMEELLEAGDHDGVLETALREVAHVPDDDIAMFRSIPGWWESRVSSAQTIPREFQVDVSENLDARLAERIGVPTLLIVGADSPGYVREALEEIAAAVPQVEMVVLEGQEHIAHVVAPAMFAEHVLAFLGEH